MKSLLAILLASVVLIVGTTVFMSENVAERRARNIEIGMTMKQVDAILDTDGYCGVMMSNKTARGLGVDLFYVYSFEDGTVGVYFHTDSLGEGFRVESKELTKRGPIIDFLRDVGYKIGLIRI